VTVYDNGLGAEDTSDAGTVISGGNIVIHEAKTAGKRLQVLGGAAEGETGAAVLTQETLRAAVGQAIGLWQSAGLDATSLARLASTSVIISDLAGGDLGLATSDTIIVDQNAANFGWFFDASATADSAFVSRFSTHEFRVGVGSPAAGRIDLVTLIAHELGHIAGLDDLDVSDYPNDLMTEYLAPGVRRVPGANHVALIAAGQSRPTIETVASSSVLQDRTAAVVVSIPRAARVASPKATPVALPTGRLGRALARPKGQSAAARRTPAPVVFAGPARQAAAPGVVVNQDGGPVSTALHDVALNLFRGRRRSR
jgi:hypothetical protein